MIECKEETKPNNVFNSVKDMDDHKVSTSPWCISCSNAYKDICLRIANIFSLDTDYKTKFFNLTELRKKCHLLRCLFYVKQDNKEEFDSIYNKGLISICDCIRGRIYHHKNCVAFTEHKINSIYGDDDHFSFLIALCLEFLLLYSPYIIFVDYGLIVDTTIVEYIQKYYSDVMSFCKEAFLLNFKNPKDCIKYVKERNKWIGLVDKIDRKKFFKDLFKNSNFIDYDGEVYVTNQEDISITNTIKYIYKDFNNIEKSPIKIFPSLNKRGRSSSIRIKPPRSVYDRLKSKSHLKFLKKLKEKGKKSKSPKLNKLISKLKI
jgi:hypothetical protein